jgi:hypothetical protein
MSYESLLSLGALRWELARYESRYGWPSDLFYRRFTAGELDECDEFVYWAGLCSLARTRGVLAKSDDPELLSV